MLSRGCARNVGSTEPAHPCREAALGHHRVHRRPGALIAAVGSLLGCVLGGLLTLAISKVPIHIRGLLYANHFLVVWDWRHYFWATVLAIISVFIASYVPAKRAAQLAPVDTLRGSSL